MEKEIQKKIFQSLEIDALLFNGAPNMRYMAGFTGEGYVFFSEKCHLVVTDSRYTIAAKEECPDCEVRLWGKEGYYAPVVEQIQKEKIKNIGFEDQILTFSSYEKIREAFDKAGLDGVRLVPVKGEIDHLRAVKKSDEQQYIRQAEAIGDRAFQRILSVIKPGMTEKQVAAYLEFYMKEEGAEGTSFDTIAASGIHSAMPHAVPTDKRLQKGDFLTMDFGCLYKGYCSDMTRTVVIGPADDRQRQIYQTVLQAQQAALDGIRPGMTGREVDLLAREVIQSAGYGDYFGHALGHSLGLEIHEKPTFSPREDQIIQPGMVITVEPGIYIEGFGGVRVEDVVIVTEKGCENITYSPKSLSEMELAI